MTAMEKPALTEALQQLSTLLPVALECCTGSDTESQNSAVVDKIRSVLLDVIGTVASNKGSAASAEVLVGSSAGVSGLNILAYLPTGSSKQLLALLKILQIVMDKLPAAFATAVPQYMLIISVVQLLGRLDLSKGAVEEQQLPILCGLAHLVEQQDHELLLELHASTVDMLLDLEHLMFEMSLPSSHAANLQLPLFQGLLVAAQQHLLDRSHHQQQHEQISGSQQQRVQQLTAAEPARAPVRDAATWQAFATLGLRFLVHQLQEYPVLLGRVTPCALVPALGQMLSYPSSDIQELGLNAMGLMVVQQPQETAMVSSALQHVIWLLDCAVEGHLPAELCTHSWQNAAAGCVSACTETLASQGLLDVAGDRLARCLCSVITAEALQEQQVLWLLLLLDVVSTCPAHAAVAALALPLTLSPVGSQQSADGSLAAAEDALLGVWRAIGAWAASADVRGTVERQVLLVLAATPSPTSRESVEDGANSPVKKKRRKLKQTQLTVTEGGFLCSQRPGKSSSQQPSDTTPSNDSTPPTAASLAAEVLQQQLALQHPDLVAAAAVRLAGLIACLGPCSPVPAAFAAAIGMPSISATGRSDGARDGDTAEQDEAQHKVRLLLLVLQGLLATADVPATLVACASQQVVAWLPRLGSQTELVVHLLPALLLSLVATVNSTAAEPAAAETHRRVWQWALEWMQGAGSLYSTGIAGPPSTILAATSVAWFTLVRLWQWAGSAPVAAAAAQMHASFTSSDPTRVVAALQLLPIMCLLQHGHFQQEGEQAAAGAAQQQLLLQLPNGPQQAFSSFFESLSPLQQLDSAVVQQCSVLALGQMLAASARCITAGDVAVWLQTAAQTILRWQGCNSRSGSSVHTGSMSVADVDAKLMGLIISCQPSSAAKLGHLAQQQQQLPVLRELLPVLQPALAGNSNSGTSTGRHTVQAAALQLLSRYLALANQPQLLSGSQPLLLDALQLVLSANSVVRDAALELLQHYLQPAVLQEVFGQVEQQQDVQRPASRSKRRQQAAAGQLPQTGAAAVAASVQRRLLEHLKQLLQQVGIQEAGSSKQQGQSNRAPEGVVAAKTSLLRAIAGLYGGLIGSDSEDLPLLCLLEQQCPAICPDDRVQAAALDLMQYLANIHTTSKEPGQLLLDSQATPALLTYVGKALAHQPQLFAQLASAAKVDEGQLAEAVAPHVVHWLCQQKLTEPLELLATKLGQSTSSLFLSKSDDVLAEQLWFDPDGLAGLIEWVDEIMAPDSTFFTVVRVMGRRMARCVIEKAGLACFWDSQYHPPRDVLERASEYVATLADVMKEEGIHGVIDLLQGETIATVLKNIGKTVAKQPQLEQVAAGSDAVDAQQQQQQGTSAAGAEGGTLWAEKLQGLRSLVVLMHLLEEHIGSHAFQLMAVLSEALLYCIKGDLLMQALAGWLSFTQLLAAHAPEVLQRVAAQAAVVLLPVLELASQGGTESAVTTEGPAAVSAVDAAAVQLAAAVLHEIVVKQRASVRPALRKMPPLPSLDMLKEVNAVLAQEQNCQSPLQHLQLLIAALRHESVAVRHVGLGEVRSFLLQYKTFMGDAMAGLLSCSGPAALPGSSSAAGPKAAKAGDGLKLLPQQCRDLYSELLSALLASCDNLPRSTTQLVDSMKQRCAQCLGLLGAIDPAHVSPELPRPAPFAYNAQSCLTALVEQHLVRVLQTACDIGQLEVTSYAIQQILQHYTRKQLAVAVRSMETFSTTAADGMMEIDVSASSPDEPGSLYSMLDDTSQSIVKPFLTTKFIVTSRPSAAPGVVFGSAPNFRRWLHAWLKVLCSQTTGPLAFAFEACRGVAFWDQPLMMYLLPFMLAEVAGQGGEGLQLIVQELTAVMQCAAGGPECHVENIELYVHCIFTQLDLLQQWVTEQQEACEKAAERAQQAAAQQAAAAGNGRAVPKVPEPQLPAFVANVATLVNAVPIQTMAEAALRCGSYARALQYFEVHVRAKHGGGLNPSAYNGGCSSYNYDDVSFLLEVYGHLEEPDGLAGLVQLRQGGLTAADQILVAEKAGDWSEALALYEQALAQEAAAATATCAGQAAPTSHAAGAVAADALTLAARAVAAGSTTDANVGQIHQLGVFKQQSGLSNSALLRLDTAAGAGAAATASAAIDGVSVAVREVLHGVSSLQVGQLRSMLQMGHYQTLLRQVDGLMARCLGAGQGFGASSLVLNPDEIIATLGTLNNNPASTASCVQSAQWCMVQLAALGVAAAWRLGSYELLRGYLGIVEAASGAGLQRGSSEDDWEACVGYILEAAHRRSHSDVVTMIKAARQGILGLLPSIAGESYTRAYPDLMKLHMLQEIEDAWGLQQQPTAVGPLQRSRLLRWPERLSLTAPLLSSRAPLLALRRQLAGLLKDNEGMGKAWLQHAKLCRSTGHQEAAETSVLEAQARNVPGALLERCRLLWDRDKGHRAVMELQLVVQQQLEEEVQPNDPAVQHQRAKELLQLTEWMAAVGQGGKEVLCANYDDAIQLDYNWEKAHFSYACYLDQLYRDAKQREGKGPKNGLDRLGGRCRVRREEESPFDYLPSALSHYGESIRAGHKHILQSLPRLLTLYFEFGNRLAASKAINQKLRSAQTQISGVMKGLVRSIPTYKWLLVLPQLTSRLCHQEKDVQEFIQTLLGSIVDHFPQQALWSMTVVVKSTVRARQEIASAVIAAARRRCSEAGKRLFDSFSKLMDQLIRACMWQPSAEKRTSRASAQREFKGLIALLPLEVQVPVQALFTVDLPPGGKLPPGHRPVSMQATIAGMKDEVVIMQSLMKPKKITFVGSDGVEYPFLAKPKDDLRKDYRLMDFAGTLNALFARQPQARRRGLSLRTYAVLPLTNDCGILQWVNNLVPFKHACEEVYVKEKIYKRHSTPMQIKKMYDSHSGTRRELMDKVLSMLPPRMSKWFLSRFPDPGTWLAARLAFTRTNAAWAMVGHVLGLGDRHGENIMINALTGETMHVDFGCLFDHGLTLEVPEMVPFRLTQNVVDCFGVSGVEGTFRCAAEMTLQVLRDNKATLMTCAETFLHDPLVDWTKGRSSSTSSATAVQDQENPQAKDALFVMEGRLSGTLLGVLATPTLPLSCEGQAARLIQEASDHENLGKMYIWWMPWL